MDDVVRRYRPAVLVAPPPAAKPVASSSGAAASYRRRPIGVILSVLLGVDLGLIALGLVLSVIVGLIQILAPESAAADSFRRSVGNGLPGAADAWLSLVMFGAIPVAWVAATRTRPGVGTFEYLGLHSPLRSLGVGIGLGGVFVGPVALVIIGLNAAQGGPTPSSGADQLVADFTWGRVALVALAAGIGEEILFRGLLIRWLGWAGQGVVFGLAHSTGGSPFQIGLTLLVGLVFGRLRRSGWSLVALMVAHATYDAFYLGVIKVAPELFYSP